MVLQKVLRQVDDIGFDEAVEHPVGLVFARQNGGVVAVDVKHLDIETRTGSLDPDTYRLVPGLAFLIMT